MKSPAKKRSAPEFLRDLQAIGSAHLAKALNISVTEALALMQPIAAELLSMYARTDLYVPVGYDIRNDGIWRDYSAPAAPEGHEPSAPFSHGRVLQLAIVHQLTPRQIYTVVREKQAASRAERGFPSEDQPALTGLDPAEG